MITKDIINDGDNKMKYDHKRILLMMKITKSSMITNGYY